MIHLKAISKIIGVFSATLIIFAILVIGTFFLKIFRVNSESWRNYCLTKWGVISARSLSINVNIRGDIPTPPFYLVSNHLSYIDIIVLFSILKTTFIAKSEVSKWPVLGTITKSIGIVFINRRKKRDVKRVNSIISDHLNKYRGVTLFAEGTTSPGAKILPFRPPLLELPARENIEVSYCVIHYSCNSKKGCSAYKDVNWWGDTPMHKHLYNLAKLSKIEATVTFGESKVHSKDRKQLAEELHQKATEIFTPMCSPEKTDYKPITF